LSDATFRFSQNAGPAGPAVSGWHQWFASEHIDALGEERSIYARNTQ
jgi:hypothetical protein